MGKNFIGMSVGQAAQVIRPMPPARRSRRRAGDVAGRNPTTREGQSHRPVPGTRCGQGSGRTRRGGGGGQSAPTSARRTPSGAARRKSSPACRSRFLVCAAGAMIVGLFLVYNAMAVTVAERRAGHRHAPFGRARPAGRSSILFAALAALLGVVGAVLGVPLGSGLAEVTLDAVPERTGVDVPEPGREPDAALVDERGAGGARRRLDGRVRGARAGGAGRQRRPGPRRPPQSAGGAKGVWRLVHRADVPRRSSAAARR